VFHSELTASDLTDAVLLDLLRMEDPHSGAIAPEAPSSRQARRRDCKDEPRLLERIVERALHTGARITPVVGPAADELADADGIAALLRW
jgi:hypothetical protein